MPRLSFGSALVLFVTSSLAPSPALAISPGSIEQGRQLFERNWPLGNPAFGADGLGPLFNAQSCVACHHQGGVGGGGDSRFNAQAIGIEQVRFSRNATNAEKVQLIRSFFPGFVQPDGSLMNTATLPHHGGSTQFAAWRSQILSHVSGVRSEEGGPPDVNGVRQTISTPILHAGKLNGARVSIRARLFQRNTTSLFGAGLVDEIPDSLLQQQAKLQERHPEISGRVSVLRDGSFGRFGWRANVSRLVRFVDRACANEMSLETKRREQGVDPSQPSYRNSAVDIQDAQIESMTEFIAALPAPYELKPTDSSSLARVNRGRAAFEEVGCAVCHVPQLGQARGIYSDLLLHDMGPYLYDLDAAEPYVVKQTASYEPRIVSGTERVVRYYGAASPISMEDVFVSPRGSTATEDFVTIASGSELGSVRIGATFGASIVADVRRDYGLKRRLKPSNTSQEWRTPPLWGVRDSAPYMHDGRAETLFEAIVLHDGESAGTRDRFLSLPVSDRLDMVAFLETLVAPANAPKPAL